MFLSQATADMNSTVRKVELIESVSSVQMKLINFSVDISKQTTTDNLMVEPVA